MRLSKEQQTNRADPESGEQQSPKGIVHADLGQTKSTASTRPAAQVWGEYDRIRWALRNPISNQYKPNPCANLSIQFGIRSEEFEDTFLDYQSADVEKKALRKFKPVA